jgi:hypothetical protein
MAVEPEEGVKLAHGRLQSTLPVRAKTRRQTITSDGTPGLLCLSNPGRRQTAILVKLLNMMMKMEFKKTDVDNGLLRDMNNTIFIFLSSNLPFEKSYDGYMILVGRNLVSSSLI